MQLLVTAALAFVVNGLTIQTYECPSVTDYLSQSFIDSVYGDLVSSVDAEQYKASKIKAGLLSSPSQIHQEFDYDKLTMGEFFNNKNKIEQQIKADFAARSHEAYMRYLTKVKYPDADDTEDIANHRNLFGGIVTFGGIPHFNCFSKKSDVSQNNIDIAIVGAPFDTGVSYRPGARFGPEGIRLSARRIGGAASVRGYGNKNTNLTHIDPYDPKSHNLSIVDCGDVPLTPFDNRIALNQLYRGERAIHSHPSKGTKSKIPKIITMGGDHTITLMTLKSVYDKYGPVNVIHFDSHIDTWDPKVLGGGLTNYMELNHGTFLHYAAEQGYLNSSGCFHVGMRAPFIADEYDSQHDKDCGFKTITAREIDYVGIRGIISKLKAQLGEDAPVYITVDIDVLDPAFAPATGTMEIGGWSTRELISVLDGLEGINLVGADVVEVSPPFDSSSEITQLAATQVIDSLLGLMIVKEIF